MIRTLLAGMAVLCFAAGPARAEPPLSAYGKLPALQNMALSPDGQALAFVAVTDEKRSVLVETPSGGLIRSVSLGEMKTRELAWAGNNHLLIFVTTTLHRRSVDHYKYEMMSVLSLNVATGNRLEVLSKGSSALGNVLGYFGSSEAGGRRFGYFRGQNLNDAFSSLFKVDLDDGATTVVADADEHAAGWVLDGQGRIVARSAFSPVTNTWSLYSGPRGDRVAFSRSSKTADLDIVGLGRTAGTVLVDDHSGDEDVMVEVPLDGAGKPQTLFKDLQDSKQYFSPDTAVLLGAVDPQRGDANFFDPLLKARFEAARKPFAKYHVTLVSFDAKFERLVLLTEGADESGTYWLVDLENGKANSLGQAYPDIPPAEVGPTSLVRYKAGDGLQIEAVLTLPPGRRAERLPLVVLPHGGPIGIADRVHFDWWAQAFASRGYAVLQPNFRGSGGYGGDFRRAGYGEWGKKMQTDLSDGVAFLATQGTIDPKRVCIVGASYGGYAALAGVTLQHGVYRCAVSYGGVSDLGATMWRSGHNGKNSLGARWEERAMGTNWSGDSSLAARSPFHQADKADVPVLLIHGKDDTVVPISESETMAAALTRAGRPHQLIRLDGEDHWLSSSQTRTQMLQAAVEFVVQHDPAG